MELFFIVYIAKLLSVCVFKDFMYWKINTVKPIPFWYLNSNNNQTDQCKNFSEISEYFWGNRFLVRFGANSHGYERIDLIVCVCVLSRNVVSVCVYR